MPLKYAKRKGTRAEHKTIETLESVGYYCVRAGSSLGLFDVIAIGRTETRCISVKSGKARLSPAEREQLQLFFVPPGMVKEFWRWPDYARAPVIERIP